VREGGREGGREGEEVEDAESQVKQEDEGL